MVSPINDDDLKTFSAKLIRDIVHRGHSAASRQRAVVSVSRCNFCRNVFYSLAMQFYRLAKLKAAARIKLRNAICPAEVTRLPHEFFYLLKVKGGL